MQYCIGFYKGIFLNHQLKVTDEELASYGLAAGLLYRLFPRKVVGVYGSLLGAMLIGRVAWGITMYLLLHGAFSWQAFAAGAFVNALPGIALHLLLIPPIVLALQKAGKI